VTWGFPFGVRALAPLDLQAQGAGSPADAVDDSRVGAAHGDTESDVGHPDPRMNSIMERWVGSVRGELLDRILIMNARHCARSSANTSPTSTATAHTGP
jgi:hypothetical protein